MHIKVYVYDTYIRYIKINGKIKSIIEIRSTVRPTSMGIDFVNFNYDRSN